MKIWLAAITLFAVTSSSIAQTKRIENISTPDGKVVVQIADDGRVTIDWPLTQKLVKDPDPGISAMAKALVAARAHTDVGP